MLLRLRQHRRGNIVRIGYLVALVAREMGWSLEYISQLSLNRLVGLYNYLSYQRQVELYRLEYRLGQMMCILASDKHHKYKPNQFIGNEPKETEVKVSMVREKKFHNLILGDGNAYEVTELNANMMEAVEDEFEKGWAELLGNPRTRVVKALLHQMLLPKHANLTRDKLGDILTPDAMKQFRDILSNQGGE